MSFNVSDIEQIAEKIVEYTIEKIKTDNYFKSFVRRTNATVTSSLAYGETNIGKNVDVKFPYDITSFSARNETGVDLNEGDLIVLDYHIDLKNAVAVYKVN